MSETCSHNCSECGSECSERTAPQSLIEKLNATSSVKKVIGVVSGKGGVGKSLVTALLAAKMQKKGYQTAVLDADITGPSIPKVFGIHGRTLGTDDGILPAVTKRGTKIMSVNLLLENDTDPVVILPISFRSSLYRKTFFAASTQIILEFHFPPKTSSPYSNGQRMSLSSFR